MLTTSKRTRVLLCTAGLLALAGAALTRDPDRVAAFPYVTAFKEFPLLLASMIAAVRWGLSAAGICLFLAALGWERFVHPLFHPEEPSRGQDRAYTSWALFFALFVFYFLVEHLAFRDYCLTPDEYAYLFQAGIFSRGEWAIPAHPLQEFFRCAFIAEHNGRLFSIMPVGWSLLLVPGVLLGIPGVLSPLCTALGVVLTFQVGRAVYGYRTGLLASLLMAVSPFVVFHSGTYLPHQASLLAYMAFLLLFIRLERGASGITPYVLLGCITAAVPIIHQIELSMLLPFFLVLGLRFLQGGVYSRPRLIFSGILCLTLFLSFTCWHLYSVTGSPTKVPYKVYVDDDNYLSKNFVTMHPVGIYSLFTLKQRLNWTIRRILSLNYCLFPFAPLFLFLPLLLRGRKKWDFLLLGSSVSLWIAYMFYNSWGGVQFGPRYYFPAVGITYLLIAECFLRLAVQVRPALRGGIAFFLLLAFVYSTGLSAVLLRFVPYVVSKMQVIQDAGDYLAQRGIHDSIILLAPSPSDPQVDSNSITLRIRNNLDFSNDNLVAMDLGERNRELTAFYPRRRFFRYWISLQDLIRDKPMAMEELSLPGPAGGG